MRGIEEQSPVGGSPVADCEDHLSFLALGKPEGLPHRSEVGLIVRVAYQHIDCLQLLLEGGHR